MNRVLRRHDSLQDAVLTLERHEVHVVPELPPSSIERLLERPDEFRVAALPFSEIEMVLFNHRHALFSNRNVRRAIARAVPRDTALSLRVDGAARANRPGRRLAGGPFSTGSWMATKSVVPYRHEPAYGRQLLREVLEDQGYELAPGAPPRWARGDETLSVRLLPAEWSRRVEYQQDFDLAIESIAPDPQLDLFSLFDPSGRGRGGSNLSGYLNPTLVEALDGLSRTVDPEILANRYHQIREILSEDAQAVFLWELETFWAASIQVVPARIHPRDLFLDPADWRLVPLE